MPGKVVKLLPLQDDTIAFTAGMTKLFVLSFTANVLSRYDLTTFEKCVRSDRYAGFVARQTEETSKNKGVTQTPTVFVNGRQLGDLSPAGLTAAVDAAS